MPQWDRQGVTKNQIDYYYQLKLDNLLNILATDCNKNNNGNDTGGIGEAIVIEQYYNNYCKISIQGHGTNGFFIHILGI